MSGLESFVIPALTGTLGYLVGKGTTDAQQQKELEELKAKVELYEQENRKLKADADKLSGISNGGPKDFSGRNSTFIDPCKAKSVRTIWL